MTKAKIIDLKNLSATKRLTQMKANLNNTNYIIDEMALAGQITLFYAKPNTGKTLLFLRFLIDAINDQRLDPDKLYYINADDNYNGLYTKAKIAHKHGFHMISPSESGATTTDIISMLFELAKNNSLRDSVIVLDTLKKFVDMMSKSNQSSFYEILRDIGMAGATIIIAGHANKHNNEEGDLVYEGTGDVLNDIDCAYSMYKLSNNDATDQVIEFRNEKDRGTVIPKVTYQYSKVPNASYEDLLNSVLRVSNSAAKTMAASNQQQLLAQKYASEIAFVRKLLTQGPKTQSDIFKELKKSADPNKPSQSSLSKALLDLDGIEWDRTKGPNNSNIHTMI